MSSTTPFPRLRTGSTKNVNLADCAPLIALSQIHWLLKHGKLPATKVCLYFSFKSFALTQLRDMPRAY